MFVLNAYSGIICLQTHYTKHQFISHFYGVFLVRMHKYVRTAGFNFLYIGTELQLIVNLDL